MRSVLVWFGVLACLSACNRKKTLEAPGAPGAAASAVRAPKVEEESFDVLRNVRLCDVKHRGILLDVGSRGVDAHREYATGPLEDVPAEERGGATFGRVLAKRVGYQFWLDEDEKDIVVSVRGSGALSKRASVYVDDKRLGTLTLSPEETRVVALPAIEQLPKGPHKVVLRFVGTQRAPDDPYAFIDWIRIGIPDEDPKEYAAPTLRQLVTDVALEERPKRSIVLRAPGTVRCAVRVVHGAKLQAALGFWGNGKGTAELRVVEDGERPVTLRQVKTSGGDGATWTPIEVSLEAFAGRVVGLELVATETTGGGRVAFGEPRVTVQTKLGGTAPKARVAVVVIGSGLDKRLVPPWGSAEGLSALSALARDGVVYDWHRVPTTVAGGVVGSLLTGLAPRAHRVEDPHARLPNEIRAIGEMVKEAGGRTAMFTGVPMSFPAFGFDRGWDTYEWFSPVQDVPATEPITRGSAWLRAQLARDAQAKVLLVIHLRGGHPPWDITRDEAAKLPPDDYGGVLEPRRGAIVLEGIRGRRSRADRKLAVSDWTRLRALEVAAFRKQNAALKQLLETLAQSGVDESALVVFFGDVAIGDAPHLPFSPMPELSEDHLVTPLIVRYPGRRLKGKRVGALVTTADITTTLVHALGVEEPFTGIGLDLYRVAAGFEPANGRPHTASLGAAFATRWGPWLMRGEVRKTPMLCQIEVDPACAHDVLVQNPIAAQALWRQTFEAEAAPYGGGRTAAREGVSLDAETQAALKVFGYGG